MTTSAEVDRFYTHDVPDQFNRDLEAQRSAARRDAEAARVLDEMLGVRTALAVEVRDTNGARRYAYEIDRGRMRPCDAPDRPVFALLEHTLDDFSALRRECGNSALGLLGAIAGGEGGLRLTRQRVRSLRELDGSLALERVGPAGFELRVHLGEREEAPRGRIRLPEEILAALRSGRLDPERAFLNGLVEIEGDTELAIGFALAVVAPD